MTSTSRTGRPRTNAAITSDSSALVLVTCLPNRRDANGSAVPRSFGRASVTGPAVVLTVTSMRIYGEICGWTLARAHARSGDRIAIAAYLGGSDVFDQAITQFATAYADQNERDHKALVDAVNSGRLTAEPDL